MKNLLLLALLSFCLLSCNRDRDKNVNPNVLPDATQSGANTAGALVDGKIWVATTKKINTVGGQGTYCEKYNGYTHIQIDLRNVSDNSRIYFETDILNMELNKMYYLTENTNSGDTNFALFSDNNFKAYYTQPNSVYIGSFKLTRLDLQNQIVSGTFEFKAVDTDGNTVNITEGRFDKRFD